MVSSSLRSAVKRAWRHTSLVASDDVDEAPPAERLGQCFVYPNIDLWGAALTQGTTNKVASAGECCAQVGYLSPSSWSAGECCAQVGYLSSSSWSSWWSSPRLSPYNPHGPQP